MQLSILSGCRRRAGSEGRPAGSLVACEVARAGPAGHRGDEVTGERGVQGGAWRCAAHRFSLGLRKPPIRKALGNRSGRDYTRRPGAGPGNAARGGGLARVGRRCSGHRLRAAAQVPGRPERAMHPAQSPAERQELRCSWSQSPGLHLPAQGSEIHPAALAGSFTFGTWAFAPSNVPSSFHSEILFC